MVRSEYNFVPGRGGARDKWNRLLCRGEELQFISLLLTQGDDHRDHGDDDDDANVTQ